MATTDDSALAGNTPLVAAGELPNRPPDRTWGGPSTDGECAICGAPLKREPVELELEFARNGGDPGADSFHVHVPCFAAWERQRDRANRTMPAGDARALPQAACLDGKDP